MTKIAVIGAGSASFGLNTLAALLGSHKLKSSHLALCDRNKEALEMISSLANLINLEWDAGFEITSHLQHHTAITDADFVVLAIEVSPREELWRRDYEIPLKRGVRQPYAENGGPGGFAHAARNIGPVMEIVRDMERYCPNAWLINYTNPMMRICDAVSRYSIIKVIGLCHQINAGYAMVGKTLAEELGITVPSGFTDTHASPFTIPPRKEVTNQAMEKITILAAGLNHFSWMVELRDKLSGEDLYPAFREKWGQMSSDFEPLTRKVFKAFGLFPIPGDEHLSEYLPWLSDPITKPWEKYTVDLYDWNYWDRNRTKGYETIQKMISGELAVDSLREATSEGALELIESISTSESHYQLAVNLPNKGQIPDLPMGAIVETPGMVTGDGVEAVTVEALPQAISELLRREITATQLCVDAVIQGDRQIALQCLLLDPVLRDMDVAELVLDDYLSEYQQYLPQFWS